MKMMKSLILGTAAGLVAIAGAQAADLPVKAKPVDYVRICSAYGAGFYYIPGTDTCLRVGGYVYIETGYNARVAVPYIYSGNRGADFIVNRDDNQFPIRTSAQVILDARTQTPIGTVRAYISMGTQWITALNGVVGGETTWGLDRAFIQFAGFTAGFTESFFSIGTFYTTYGVASAHWAWLPVFAYTAQLGNGLSATLSFENATSWRTKLTTGTYTGIGTAATGYGGQEWLDVVGNLRVDQAWGTAQISGALHQLRMNQALSATISDAWGYAISGAIEIKTPMIAPGDSLLLQATWTRGAVEYTGLSSGPGSFAGPQGLGIKNLAGVGPGFDVFDAYYSFAGFGSALQLTQAWSANAMFRHFWQPNLRSTFWVGYNSINPGGNSFTAFGADPNFTMVQAGANVIWSPAPALDLSLDVIYSQLRTGSCTGALLVVQAASCNLTADVFSGWMRWRRNF